MKVVIAGGRDTKLTETDKKMLLDMIEDNTITELVCGMARGIDIGSYNLLQSRVPVKEFPADWKTFGKGAGFIRNEQMAKYADAAILFKGGNGTADMRHQAERYNLKIILDRNKE